MEEGLHYPMKIEDGMSGPAHHQTSALHELESAIKSTERALEAFRGAAEGHGSELMEMAKAGGVLGYALGAVAVAAVAAAAKVGELGFEATKFAIESAEFRENAILAYTAVKGTAEEGEKTFEQIDKIAGQMHMPADKAHDLARDLMLQGLTDTKLIGETIEAQAALMRTGQIAGAEKLTKIIERSTASGHFDPGKMGAGKHGAASGRALAGLGVSLPGLISQIAQDTHKSITQVSAELKAGKITVEEGVAGLTSAITHGVIGQTARAKYDIHDFTTDSENYFRRMVQGINLKPLEQGLLDVSTAIGFVADHKGGIEAVFQAIVDGAGKAIEKGLELGEDMVISFLRTELALSPVIHALQSMYHVIEQIQGLAGTGFLATAFGVTSPLANLQTIMKSQETNGGREAGVDMGTDLVKGARDATHTHSPSEDMKDFGRDLRSGLDIGFKADTIGAEVNAINAPGGSDSSSASTKVHVEVGGIHVNGSGTPHETAALLESQVADIFERLGLELGN